MIVMPETTNKKTKITTKTESFVVHYPDAIHYAKEQIKIFWTDDEINVDKDVHDILTNFSESEKHATITVLKLFTLYELKAGADYWLGRFMRTYPRPEIMRMAATFGMFELAVHKPFYNKINEALHLNTDEFYESYIHDPLLKSRMDFIDSCVTAKDDLFSVGVFSMVEGGILYSAFAFLKHFQSKGKNKLLNVVRGINFSVRDENCLDENTLVKCVDGWKLIKDVTLNDKVLQYSEATGEFSYVNPYNLTSTKSNVSYHFIGDSYEQVVTPEHRMIIKNGEVLAKDATNNLEYRYVDDVIGAAIDTTVIKTKVIHNEKEFYCLSVDAGAFVIKYNNKTSITGNCHAVGGAWVYRQHKKELNLTQSQLATLENNIIEAAHKIYEHECRIIDMMWENGDIPGISKESLKVFVASRLNLCLQNLEIRTAFEVNEEENTIATWFYDSINKYVFNDFFSGIGREYVRDWNEEDFEWKPTTDLV